MSLDGAAIDRVRLALYRGFAETGSQPRPDALATSAQVREADLDDALSVLEQQRHVVRRRGAVVLAHPFAGRNFAFSVMSESTLWWGGCAWDAFAIPALLRRGPVLVATTCPACATAHAWTVGSDDPPAGDQVAHFLVPMRSVWDDVIYACSNQRIFCSSDCVRTWLQRRGLDEGSQFSLSTLWRLASHWYDGRLDRSYTRRDPQEAGAYFAGVGLTGPFWS